MKYLPIFQDMAEALSPFSREDKGEILEAMLAYAFDGEIRELSGCGKYVWPMIRQTIDKSRERYEKLAENGRSGAAARWGNDSRSMATDSNGIATDSQSMATDSPSIANDAYQYQYQTNINTNTNTKSMGASRFVPPTEEEVRAYVTEKGGTPSQAEQIFAYYESNGWRVGKNPMRKWRAAVSGWISRDKERATPRTAPVKSVPEQLYSQRDYGSGNIIPDDWLEAAQ